jgi:small subunit ribosomal protein S8
MAVTDPVADYLTRIRNAQMARHRMVEIPASNLKKRITEILYSQGYILKYKFDDADNKQGVIKIALKYKKDTREPVIRKMKRVSRPGLRQYVKATELPRVINGLGVAVVSTSKGVITDKEARKENVGGEVLFTIY